MELDVARIYDRMPEEMQSRARKWYYLLDPRRSWEDRIKPETTTDEFIDRFFEDEAEFRAFETEFFEGPVPEVMQRAAEDIPDEYSIYDAHRDECLKYYALIRKLRPSTVVETGVYNGVSTCTILAALAGNDQGTLHSVDYSQTLSEKVHEGRAELDPTTARQFTRERPSCAEPNGHILVPGKDPGWLVPNQYRDRWEYTPGRSRELLPQVLDQVDAVDFFLHDSEHSTACMLFEFELVWHSLSPGGLMVSSHVDWNDAFEQFAEERSCKNGLISFHYLGYRESEDPIPCSTGYIRNPPRDDR